MEKIKRLIKNHCTKSTLYAIKNESGITLIVLVVTIIVLLILAAVTVANITGGDKTIDKAQDAKIQHEKSDIIERINAAVLSSSTIEGDFIVEDVKNAITSKVSGSKIQNNSNKFPLTVLINNKVICSVEMDGSVIPLIDTGSIKIGDIVNYTPSGTYSWNAEYATSYSNGSTSFNNANKILDSSAEEFKITTWKVLNIDKKTGNIEIVPVSPTTGMITLQGANGYNNSVYLLNNACSKLYENIGKGITARSINEQDFIDAQDGTKWNDFKLTNTTYGEQVASPYTTYAFYPNIYAEEYNSVIDNNKNTSNASLTTNKQHSLITGYTRNAKSIQPYQTAYKITDYDTTKNLLSSDKKDILLPNGNNTRYWMASRCISVTSTYCLFSIMIVNIGSFKTNLMFSSGGGVEEKELPIFPVVSINYTLLEETSTPGAWSVK